MSEIKHGKKKQMKGENITEKRWIGRRSHQHLYKIHEKAGNPLYEGGDAIVVECKRKTPSSTWHYSTYSKETVYQRRVAEKESHGSLKARDSLLIS